MGKILSSGRYNPTYWPTDQNRIGYGFAVKKQQLVAKKNNANPAAHSPNVARTDMDRLRLRITRLERKVDALDSAFTVTFLALAAIGLGVAAYYNWSAIQGTATAAREKMYSWDEIKTGGKQAWDWCSAFFTPTQNSPESSTGTPPDSPTGTSSEAPQGDL